MEYDPTIDEYQISTILVRERYYRDSCQWDKLRNAYHPDASKTAINISWYNGDIDGFVKGSREMAAKGSSAMHVITPVEIDIKGEKAFAVSVGSINVRFERDGRVYDLISHCRFLSRLERIHSVGSNRWRLLSMEVIYVHDSVVPAFPGDGKLVLVAENSSSTARSSYRYLTWLLEAQGRKVDDSMPGMDNEASVKEVLDKNYRWLNL